MAAPKVAGRPARIDWDEPQTWYFTFGFAHEYRMRFYVIKNATSGQARDRMMSVFGRNWAFQYDAHDWFKYEGGTSQAEKFGLTEVK